MSWLVTVCLVTVLLAFGCLVKGFATVGLLCLGLVFVLLSVCTFRQGAPGRGDMWQESPAERETRVRYRRAEAEAQDAIYYEAEYRDVSDPRKGGW